MSDSNRTAQQNRAMRLLANGFSAEFSEFIYSDQRTTELFHTLAEEFVSQNIPIVEEENRLDLALMLMEQISITNRA
jgi:hypothetical protein